LGTNVPRFFLHYISFSEVQTQTWLAGKKNSNTAASAKERELAWQKITDRVNV